MCKTLGLKATLAKCVQHKPLVLIVKAIQGLTPPYTVFRSFYVPALDLHSPCTVQWCSSLLGDYCHLHAHLAGWDCRGIAALGGGSILLNCDACSWAHEHMSTGAACYSSSMAELNFRRDGGSELESKEGFLEWTWVEVSPASLYWRILPGTNILSLNPLSALKHLLAIQREERCQQKPQETPVAYQARTSVSEHYSLCFCWGTAVSTKC